MTGEYFNNVFIYFYRNILPRYFIPAVAAALLFTGCSGSSIQYPQPSSAPVNGGMVSRQGTFNYWGREYIADYATISVPENRKNPASRLIHLPVIRIHARGGVSKEPLFQLSGGPGQSNMGCWLSADSLLFDHDYVMVGYRGVEGSSILNYPEVADAITGSGDSLMSDESIKAIGAAWTAGTARLLSEGVDLNGYTMTETVEDMEAVRYAFKYDKINLFSGSYGTRLAYLYGVMHPQVIKRTVMIGVNPPGGFVWDQAQLDRLLKHYAQLWQQDPEMSEKCPDILAAMQKVMNNIPHKWLLFSIDRAKLKIATFAMLYNRKTAALVFDAYADAADGDYDGIALMAMAYDFVIPGMGVWGDMAGKSITADRMYWEKIKDQKDTTLLGTPMNQFLWKPMVYGNLPFQMIADSLQSPLYSDVQTLMISGSLDFANPPECGAGLLHYLKNGRQVVINESGHVGDLLYLQQAGSARLITSYINDGTADTSGIKYVPMDFDAGIGFSGITKAAQAAGALVLLLLTAGIIWIF